MELALNIVFFIVGLFLIIKGGDYFVDSSVQISRKFKIPAVVIGATVVAIATTLPEYIFSTLASYKGEYDLAIGNAVGSMITNTCLICGLSIIFLPSKIFRGSLTKYLLLLFGVCFLALSAINGWLDLWETLCLIGLFVDFIVVNIIEAKKSLTICKDDYSKNVGTKSFKVIMLRFIIGALGIGLGAMTLVNSAIIISTYIGVSSELIGLTVIALGTSLPELTTTIVAIKKKEVSLGYGNVIGSNIINLSLILGTSGVIGRNGIKFSEQTLFFSIPILFLSTLVFVVPLIFKSKSYRIQGILLASFYILYILIIANHIY